MNFPDFFHNCIFLNGKNRHKHFIFFSWKQITLCMNFHLFNVSFSTLWKKFKRIDKQWKSSREKSSFRDGVPESDNHGGKLKNGLAKAKGGSWRQLNALAYKRRDSKVQTIIQVNKSKSFYQHLPTFLTYKIVWGILFFFLSISCPFQNL